MYIYIYSRVIVTFPFIKGSQILRGLFPNISSSSYLTRTTYEGVLTRISLT